MAIYFGWDIGGVHLKLARLETGVPGHRAVLRTWIEPFEIWRDAGALPGRLRRMLRAARPGSRRTGGRRGGLEPPAPHAVTMTAELSDVFAERAAGVRAILSSCAAAFAPATIGVLDLEARLVTPGEALEWPLRVAAANFMATARLAGRLCPSVLLIDVGSTTTDIIPIRGGRPRPHGRTDTERLVSGELVYTGLLRTPPGALTDSVPLSGGRCRVSSEYFTIMADVYRLLGRIDEAEYTVPTPDGRGKGRADAAARLARLVCSETATLGAEAIERIASFLEERQVERVAAAVSEVLARQPAPRPARAVIAGAGSFLAEAAARRAGLDPVPLTSLLPGIAGERWDRAAPSAALALLLAERAGETILSGSGSVRTGPGGRRGRPVRGGRPPETVT
ncbi:MAG TPA: hydantoinase/oxoprolinase family protein [Candidatus Polarisedimenticolia bacterium]|nr:hydantoinase/oxoprolinase family protein [Candidatus Polarisedimenticolia bacterium]